jgi:GNAT superfamily N-acetyltransferase
VDHAVIGRPPDGPQLRLDHERFAYAGKFVMSNTGKAVARDDGEVVAAVAFNADRTDGTTLWLRYVTVRADRRGEGVGPDLCAFLVARATGWGYDTARIAVNNPFAFHALAKAGFAWTGETTGIAELVLERPTAGPERDPEAYRAGLERFGERDLSPAERSFVEARAEDAPPT